MSAPQKFKQIASWNMLEALYYKLLLTAHQACFFVVNPAIYGVSSALLATVYLAIEVGNFGLDKMIAQLVTRKAQKSAPFVQHVYLQFFFLIFCSSLLLVTDRSAYRSFTSLLSIPQLTHTSMLLLALLFISESIRKTVHAAAQLFFLNRLNALVSICIITLYMILFWSGYAYTKSITVELVLIPLLLHSLVGNIVLLPAVIQVWREQTTTVQTNLSFWEIGKLRFQNSFLKTSELCFSSNFLMILLAALLGSTHIGLPKLANNIAVAVQTFIEKVFGPTSLAIFARESDPARRMQALRSITKQLYITTGVMSLLASLATGIVLITQQIVFFDAMTIVALLVFVFTVINSLLITYERFIIVSEKSFLLALANYGASLFVLALVKSPIAITPLLLLPILIMIRLGFVMVLPLIVKRK